MIDGKRLTQSPGWGQASPAPSDRPNCRRLRRPSLPAAGCSGFTAIELMIVIGVIAILVMMAVPSLAMLGPHYMVRSSAKGLDSMMQNARLLAGNTQKPTRVVMDCRPTKQKGDGSSCTIRLYTAKFNSSAELASWTEIPMMSREVSSSVEVSSPSSNVVADNPAGVYWVVFLPTGRASTSHDPMRLRFRTAAGSSATLEVGVSRQTGRVTVRKR